MDISSAAKTMDMNLLKITTAKAKLKTLFMLSTGISVRENRRRDNELASSMVRGGAGAGGEEGEEGEGGEGGEESREG